MSQSSGYCGRLTCRTEWTRARWENAASLVAWSESWLGSLGVTGRLAVPSLKRSSTWWASRVVPHNHCRLDGSPEMGSSSDAARRLALKLQAIYNYPLFLFFSPGEVPPEQGSGDGCASSSGRPATLHVWELSHFLSSSIRCLLGPRSVWTPFVVMGRQTPWRAPGMSACRWDTSPPSDLDFDLSWKLQPTRHQLWRSCPRYLWISIHSNPIISC